MFCFVLFCVAFLLISSGIETARDRVCVCVFLRDYNNLSATCFGWRSSGRRPRPIGLMRFLPDRTLHTTKKPRESSRFYGGRGSERFFVFFCACRVLIQPERWGITCVCFLRDYTQQSATCFDRPRSGADPYTPVASRDFYLTGRYAPRKKENPRDVSLE